MMKSGRIKNKIFKIGVKLKLFEKLKFENIGTLENYLKMEVLKIKFKKWNFEESFLNRSFEN